MVLLEDAAGVTSTLWALPFLELSSTVSLDSSSDELEGLSLDLSVDVSLNLLCVAFTGPFAREALPLGRLSFLLLLPIWVCSGEFLLPKEDAPLWVLSSPEGGGSLKSDSSPEGGTSPEGGDQLLLPLARKPAAQPATTMLKLLWVI